MEKTERAFVVLLILNLIKGVECDDGLTGLVAATTVTGVLLLLVIAMGFIFAFWRDHHKKLQHGRGRVKVPREWLDYERKVKHAKKIRLKRHLKEQIRQQNSSLNKENGGRDVEMQYMHRSRPQIPGSWRNEIRHPNGYIVKEVPTLQRTVLVDNTQQPVMVETSRSNDSAIWLRGHTPPEAAGYTQLSQTTARVNVPSHIDIDDSSSSAQSTLKVSDKDRLKNNKYKEDDEMVATLDFSNDIVGDDDEVQERGKTDIYLSKTNLYKTLETLTGLAGHV